MSGSVHHATPIAIWHDLECGGYAEDLGVWRALADRQGGPVLEVGAGTGRVALELARAGHEVTGLDREPALIAELVKRAGELAVTGVVGDGREFELGRRFALIILPMQTIQLLGGRSGRRGFLTSAVRHLRPGGVVAAAIAERVEPFTTDNGCEPPGPDVTEVDGVVYVSQPTAVRAERRGFVLERVRETIAPDGRRTRTRDRVGLDRLTASELEREASAPGLTPLGRQAISPTRDHMGSLVVELGG